MGVTNSLTVPKGTSAQQPGVFGNTDTPTPVNGMIRYNSDTDQFEGYQNNSWRVFRFKEPGLITQQNLGAGDGTNLYFGPISPSPSTFTAQSGTTWNTTQMAKNMLVIVENVLQVSGTNFTVVLNPTIAAETYVGASSASTSNGATTMYFNSALIATGASGSTGTVRLTFTTRPAAPFAVGSTIVVTGFNPAGYNGNYTVTDCTTTYVEYANATTATMITAGAITSSVAIYPAVNITGATVTGSGNLFSPTTVTTYAVDADTDALVSITIHATTGIIAANTAITLTESQQAGSGYYLFFSSPPPYGKIVTALIGFDQ